MIPGCVAISFSISSSSLIALGTHVHTHTHPHLSHVHIRRRLNIGKRSVKLMIWDTAGQERFHSLGPIYYRDAQGAALVYDITDADSFTKVCTVLHRTASVHIYTCMPIVCCDYMHLLYILYEPYVDPFYYI